MTENECSADNTQLKEAINLQNITEIEIEEIGNELIGDCKYVYVQIPELDSNEVIVSDRFEAIHENAHTIFIEVPNASAKTASESCTKQATYEVDEIEIPVEEIPSKNYFDGKSTILEKGQVTISSSKKQVLQVEPLPKIFKQTAILARPRKRESHKVDKVKKTFQPLEESPKSDLLWLLNFKLDSIIKTSSLDEPTEVHKDETKKDDGSQTTAKNKQNYEEPEKSEHKKPPFTYTELIECALQEKGPLTVSEIYQWISETFPYYKAWDDRWKNSVRHNLSINPYFRKGSKARQGAGHLWTVSNCVENSRSWNVKRQRYKEFEAYTKRMKRDEAAHDAELDAAREAEIAAAIIEDKENRIIQSDVFLPNENQALEQSAGEILSGVKRNVTVEYIESPKHAQDSNDFLNPVSKEVLMGECGFLNQIELNLTAESTESLEEVQSEQEFEHLDDLGFHFSDVTSQCTQLMSLVN